MEPTALPVGSVGMSVNGRVRVATGLKLMFGNVCVNKGCCVFGVLKTPDPSAVKNCPVTEVVVSLGGASTHVAVTVFEVIFAVQQTLAVATIVSVPGLAPK